MKTSVARSLRHWRNSHTDFKSRQVSTENVKKLFVSPRANTNSMLEWAELVQAGSKWKQDDPRTQHLNEGTNNLCFTDIKTECDNQSSEVGTYSNWQVLGCCTWVLALGSHCKGKSFLLQKPQQKTFKSFFAFTFFKSFHKYSYFPTLTEL